MNFQIRQASSSDIAAIQVVRNSVKENTLSDPSLVSDQDCEDYLMRRGRGWVAEVKGEIIGFAIADLQEHNVWALFLHPQFEKMGIGRALHDTLLNWYFNQTEQTI